MTITRLVLAILLATAPVLASAQSVPAQAPVTQSQAGGAPSAERKGFIVGIGVGAARHSFLDVTFTTDRFGRVTSTRSVTSNSFAIATDFKIGYAPTDKLLIYYSNKAAFSQADGYDLVGLTGAGVTYMLKRSSPTFFFTGSGGAAIAGNLFESLINFDSGEGLNLERGFGFSAGGGFEFTRHLSIAGDAVFLRLGGNNNQTILSATFNYLFY